MFKIAVLAVALLAVGALAQKPKRCEMPQEWEARRVSFDPNERRYHNHSSEFRVYGQYAYDGVNMRKWMLDEESAGDSSDNEYYEILELYHERKAYVTNRHTRRCTVYRIEHPFYHHDISPNATFTGYETLGSYPDQLTLTQWFDPRYSFEYAPAVRYQTFTHDCVPVRDDKMGDSFGFVYEEFADVTIGISNPNLFIPPQNCEEAF